MAIKTQHCETCEHFDGTKAVRDLPACDKGHRPRFYPPTNDNPHHTQWGWKRRCEDLKEYKHDTAS